MIATTAMNMPKALESPNICLIDADDYRVPHVKILIES